MYLARQNIKFLKVLLLCEFLPFCFRLLMLLLLDFSGCSHDLIGVGENELGYEVT